MKTAAWVLGVSCLVVSFASGAQASDYEFGLALMSELGYDDLAEAHFEGLITSPRSSPKQRLAGTAGMGGLLRRMAEAETSEAKRAELYRRALEHLTRFLDEAPRNDPLRAEIVAERSGIERKLAVALTKEAIAAEGEASREEAFAAADGKWKTVMGSLAAAANNAFGEWDRKRDDLKLLERAFVARQHHLNAMLERGELHPPNSEQRKLCAAPTIKIATDQVDAFLEFDMIVMWMEISLGRALGQSGDFEGACRKGFDPVIDHDTRRLRGPVRAYADELRLHAYFRKAQAGLEARRFKDVISTVDLMTGLEFRDCIKKEIGRRAVVMKTDALAGLGRYQQAIDGLKTIKRHVKPGSTWASRIVSKRKEYRKGARAAGVSLGPDPEAQRSEALERYRKGDFIGAVRAYRAAIDDSRHEKVPAIDRLRWEPLCWIEMGQAYHKAGMLYESALAFETLLKEFSPRAMGERFAAGKSWARELAKIKAVGAPDEHVKLYNVVAERPAYSKLLGELRSQVLKAGDFYQAALAARMRLTGALADRKLWEAAWDRIITVDPAKAPMRDYYRAVAAYDDGRRMLDESRKLLTTDAAVAGEKLRRAVALLDGAITAFKTIASDNRLHESSVYRIPTAQYNIADALHRSRSRVDWVKADEITRRCRLALAGYREYEATITAVTAADEDSIRRRRRRAAETNLVRPLTSLIMGDFARAVTGCDSWIETSGARHEQYLRVLWTKFRAHRGLALAKGTAPEAVAGHVDAMTRIAETIGAHPKSKKRFRTACLYLASDLVEAARAIATAKPETSGRYRRLAPEWRRRALGPHPSMEDMGPVAGELARIGRHDEALALYEQILSRFDPDGDLETRAFSRDLLSQWREKIWYDAPPKQRRARSDFDRIVTAVFGDPALKGLRDYGAAIAVIDGMVGEQGYAKDIQIATDLKALNSELRNRLMLIVATREAGNCCLSLARRGGASQDETTGLLRSACVRFTRLLDYCRSDADLRLDLAGAHAQLGAEDPAAYDEAVALYVAVADGVAEKSARWFRANRELSETLLAMGKPQEAVAFPVLMIETMAGHQKEAWPDMARFVEKCKAAGAKVVSSDRVLTGDPVDYTPLTEIEREYRKQRDVDQSTMTKEQYEQRLKRAEEWRDMMLLKKRRADEKDQIATKHLEMIDEADGAAKKSPSRGAELRQRADKWRDSQMDSLSARWKAEDGPKE